MKRFPHETHNWLVHKLMWERLEPLAGRYARGRLLDVGCGSTPYRTMFETRVESYHGLDFPVPGAASTKASVEGDAMQLPIGHETVDTVLCTELLEHLPRPADAIAEFYRVLRPGGYVILTTPLFWHLHEEPRDYYRFTEHGLRHLMVSNGLKTEKILPVSGFVATFVQLRAYYLRFGIRGARFFRWVTTPFNWIAQRAAYLVNKFDRTQIFNCVYICVARKPGT